MGNWRNWRRSWAAPCTPSAAPPAGRSGSHCPGSARWTTGGTDRPGRQPAAGLLGDALAEGVGDGVAVGGADVAPTVGCGVTVWCGVAVRRGDAVADGGGARGAGGRLGAGVGVGDGESLCCPAPWPLPATAVGA